MTSVWLFYLFAVGFGAPTEEDVYARQSKNPWFVAGTKLVNDNLKVKDINKKAKGVILFLGDGMGPSTVTAARILEGQLNGQRYGEENVLSWETFPNVGFSKTYNVNKQVSDSAGTATAYMTGVKANSGVVSVNENVTRGNCSQQIGNEVLSIAMIAEEFGLSTGLISTARITHATPSTVYAHAADRNWEADVKMPPGSQDCPDIARQLIESEYGDGLDIIFGGGRKFFLPNTTKDYTGQKYGERQDKRNLILEWQKKTTNRKFVWNRQQFDHLKPDENQVLGLFNYDHMEYEYTREETQNEPSLAEMVEFAIKSLSKNSKGYFLFVEGGRIDHGHHENKPVHALHDTVALSKAVEKAKLITNPDETLLIVTADHSHVFTMGGYQARGNDIFGLTESKAMDGKYYATLAYADGPGAKKTWPNGRTDATLKQLQDPEYRREALVPFPDESHGGEDVGIYAYGPQAHMVRGVVEQNFIFHVMDYALCLTQSKKEVCKEQGLIQ